MNDPNAGQQPDHLSVLIVEDEATHQLLIRKALSKEGSAFSVLQFARSSEEAVRFAKQMSFDVLLVDNRIPGARGLDLLTELRESGVTAPFVLMTSAGSEDLVVQAYRQNVSDYIIKDSGFWKDLPGVLSRVIAQDRAKKREHELLERLERTNGKLDALHRSTEERVEKLRGEVKALAAAVAGLDAKAREVVEAHIAAMTALL
ncbi:MAG: response regulator [Myxococcales bacterium]|nr:response regulator [Myxococcales bacterium]MCB9733197.1 response regulator [Deltaproteobacteria bacterium]